MPQNNKPVEIVESVVNSVMGVKPSGEAVAPNLSTNQSVDWLAIAFYIGGTGVQITVMILALWGLQQLMPMLAEQWRLYPTLVFFALVSVRSRLFSPLDNTRSSRTYDSIKRPGWAPPPLAFPIVWMSIAVLRVIASYWVWQASGQNFLTLPLILFMIHLALGDTWNTIFTVQSRLGAALPVVILGPFISAIGVTAAYGAAIAKAGYLLIPMCVWLTIASLLVFDIWRLNGKEPLYPIKRGAAI